MDAHRAAERKPKGGMTYRANPGGLSFLDAFEDVFTPPNALPLYREDNEVDGRLADARHIRGYFRKALSDMGLEEEPAEYTIVDLFRILSGKRREREESKHAIGVLFRILSDKRWGRERSK